MDLVDVVVKNLDETDKRITLKIIDLVSNGLKSRKGSRGYSVHDVYNTLKEHGVNGLTMNRVDYLMIYMNSSQLLREQRGRYFPVRKFLH